MFFVRMSFNKPYPPPAYSGGHAHSAPLEKRTRIFGQLPLRKFLIFVVLNQELEISQGEILHQNGKTEIFRYLANIKAITILHHKKVVEIIYPVVIFVADQCNQCPNQFQKRSKKRASLQRGSSIWSTLKSWYSHLIGAGMPFIAPWPLNRDQMNLRLVEGGEQKSLIDQLLPTISLLVYFLNPRSIESTPLENKN